MRLCYATEIGTRAIPRRFSLRSKTALCCAVFAVSADSALSQSYPIRPLRIIVASSPSSAADVVARILAQHLSDDLGQQVIVENRAGAGGNIGAKIAASAAADGYTLFLATPAHVISSGLSRKPGYDLADYLISQASSGMYVIVANPSIAVQSINELVALAKSKPGRSTTREVSGRPTLLSSCSSRWPASIWFICLSGPVRYGRFDRRRVPLALRI